MQNDNGISSYASNANNAASHNHMPSLFSFQDQYCTGKNDFGLTSPVYSPRPSLYTDQKSLYESRILMQNQQDMVNRHTLMLRRLRDTTEELETLRQENGALLALNRELNQHVSRLIQASVQNHLDAMNNSNATQFEVASLFHNLNLGMKEEEAPCEQEQSPTSVMDQSGSSGSSGLDVERVALPKSISVRSNGYLKTGQVGVPTKARVQQPPTQLTGKQKVYVKGSKKEEEPLELEVFNQGMFKTELCNKWQETGACPYGDHCQFAHGIGELRPVIRHPRYKTEVCRMILSGDNCPYGHRCHFRHALTDQERFMGNIKPRSKKHH
ncbi:hypothetical protein ACFE04_018171 [Oxalis oulophora]